MIAIEFSVPSSGHSEPGVAQEAGAGVPLRGAPAHSVQGLRQGLRQRGPPGMGHSHENKYPNQLRSFLGMSSDGF